MDIEPPRASFSDHARAGAGYGGYGQRYGAYSGYGARRSFSRTSRDDEDYGYRSDLPAEDTPSANASSFSAAAGYKRAQTRGYAPAPSLGTGAKDYAAFKTGVRVRHPKFGDGMIVSTRGEGSALVANVSFPGLGIKSLSVQIAPITIIK